MTVFFTSKWHILIDCKVAFCRLIADVFIFPRNQKISFNLYFSSVMKTLIFQVQNAPLVTTILLRLRTSALVIVRVRQNVHVVRKENGTVVGKRHIGRSVF